MIIQYNIHSEIKKIIRRNIMALIKCPENINDYEKKDKINDENKMKSEGDNKKNEKEEILEELELNLECIMVLVVHNL